MARFKVEYYASGCVKGVEASGLFMTGQLSLDSDGDKKPVLKVK